MSAGRTTSFSQLPDFSTLSKRQLDLDVQILYIPSNAGLHLLVDSTGLRFLGEAPKFRKPTAILNRFIELGRPQTAAVAYPRFGMARLKLFLCNSAEFAAKKQGDDLHRPLRRLIFSCAHFH